MFTGPFLYKLRSSVSLSLSLYSFSLTVLQSLRFTAVPIPISAAFGVSSVESPITAIREKYLLPKMNMLKDCLKNPSMALDQYFAPDWQPIMAATTESEKPNGCFDCSICLEFARDPVVTLCGHLYCWACIYKWLHLQTTSLDMEEHPECPVCKAEISHAAMVPLYGRGQTPTAEVRDKAPQLGITIPPRPSAVGIHETLSPANGRIGQPQVRFRNNRSHLYGGHEEDSSSILLNMGGDRGDGVFHPMAGLFREVVYAHVFGSSLYTYPNSFHVMERSNPRLRRMEMQADKSLNRVSIFLFCFFIWCLVLF